VCQAKPQPLGNRKYFVSIDVFGRLTGRRPFG
jgi:hypothetical protein